MDDIQFQNMDSWRGNSSGKFGLTFQQIVLMHVNRCVINGSVEWHGGYWQERQQQAWTEKRYIQNSREVYCNSVRMLRALLLGYFDAKIKQSDEKIQKEIDKNSAKFIQDAEKFSKLEYYEGKVELHIQMFEELVMLAKRLNFFQEEVSEEEL